MNSGSPAKWLSDNVEALISGEIINGFGIDFCRDVVSNAPVHVISNVKCPILFLQGTSDNIYRITDAKIAYNIIESSGGNARHVEIKNGTHELENVIDEAMKHMYDWLLPILSEDQANNSIAE